MKNLYRVDVSFPMYVLAENPDEAESIAKKNAQDAACDMDLADAIAGPPVTRLDSVPEAWHKGLPWGFEDPHMTVEKLIKALPKEEPTE
jgi:hypothetical protein